VAQRGMTEVGRRRVTTGTEMVGSSQVKEAGSGDAMGRCRSKRQV
jgi:hypothetical protein